VRAHRPSQVLSAVSTVVKGHRKSAAAVAAAAVCVALLTFLGLRSGRQPEAPPPVADKVAAVLRPALTPLSAVEVTVRTTPPGAEIFDESGRSLGLTPRTLSLPPGGTRTVRFERQGYRTVDEEVRADAPGGLVNVVMQESSNRAKKRQSRATSRSRR
jgi:hypothetical protein